MFSAVIPSLVVLVFLLWFWFNQREKARVAQGLTHHSGLRLAFAAIGAATAIFAGGCGAIIGVAEAMRPKSGSADDFMNVGLVLMLSLPPLLLGAFIWWLSMRRNKPET